MTSPAHALDLRTATSGWGLTLRISIALVLGSAALLAIAGAGESGVRMWIRATARSSATLFLFAFSARPLVQFWRVDASRWLLRNRRYIGASAALSHVIHATAITTLFVAHPSAYQVDLRTLIGGGLGFGLFFAMGLTSNDASVAALGKRGWKLLHTIGGYYVGFIFALTFVPDPKLGWDLTHGGFIAAFLGVLALRFAAWATSRRHAQASV